MSQITRAAHRQDKGATGEGEDPDQSGAGVQQTTAPKPAPVRQRRRPGVAALGVALIAVCGIGGGWLASQGGHSRQVVMLRHTVHPGHAITMGDLTTTELTGASGAHLVAAARVQSLVGTYPVSVVPAGTLVSTAMTTTDLAPAPGSTLVGISVKQGQLPGVGLTAGQTVQIVLTAGSGGSSGGSGSLPDGLKIGQTWSATVASVTAATGSQQASTVDVYVSAGDAPTVATASGTGDLAIILDTPGKRP